MALRSFSPDYLVNFRQEAHSPDFSRGNAALASPLGVARIFLGGSPCLPFREAREVAPAGAKGGEDVHNGGQTPYPGPSREVVAKLRYGF